MFYIARTEKGVSLLVLPPTAHTLVKKKEATQVRGTVVQTIDPDLSEGVTYSWPANEIQPVEVAFHNIPDVFRQAKKEFLATFFRARHVKD